ncbi:phosphoserine phosphatase SerB [Polynucleobacter cosmopolitanus]|uniref:Phosphoserine phosphatase n=1 Tax=Polynucleobacter cosmopolitanus TaxID=351345 RepID=A0A229FTB0_9BURK|nr:phosphoserine phosphatase SerB [Polynucleobacter cosmopolitanus]
MNIALFHQDAIEDQLIREIEKSHAIVSIEKKTPRTAVLELKEALNIEQRTHLRNLGVLHQTDVGFLPKHFKGSDIKVLAMDMDSTLINIECIDEIADAVGKKKEVSEITEAAMRGEIIDFGESLRKRVALLKGVPASAFDEVFSQRLRLNPGAKELIAGAHAKGIHTLLVSGGFTFFTHKLQVQLNLSETHANQLEIVDGFLTGQVLGNIVDGEAKAAYVEARCLALGANKHAAITMGDGSNDLQMMHGAGLSIAYRAKPVVKEKADLAFDHVGLDACLDLL